MALAMVELMLSALIENPQRVGGRLRQQLSGFRSARRAGYRIIYEIEGDQRVVIVLRIDHRSQVYRRR